MATIGSLSLHRWRACLSGSCPRESERMADEAIEQWEKRGAFDEPSIYDGTTWQILAERLKADHPEAFQAVYDVLVKEEARRREALTMAPEQPS